MVTIIEHNENLFQAPKGSYFVQCGSSDLALGAGIALQFNEYFDTKNKLQEEYPNGVVTYTGWKVTCVYTEPVFTLITKEHFYDKPTYRSLEISLKELIRLMENMNITMISMPAIGCGLDGLKWEKVKELLKKTFSNTNFVIHVYFNGSDLYERPKLEVYPTHIEFCPYEKGDRFEIEKMYSKWNKGKHRYEPVGYMIEDKRLYLPKGTNPAIFTNTYTNTLIRNCSNQYTKIRHFPSKDVYLEPKEHQIPILEFMNHEGKHASANSNQYVLNSSTGSGKTFCTCSMICKRGICSLIIVHSTKIKDQWVETFKKDTSLDDRDVVELDSAKMIEDYREKKKTGLVFITGHQLCLSYVKAYGWEKFNEFLEICGIGIKVYDEAHLFFENILRIDFKTNIMETYYLTATFSRTDAKENKIFNEAFSKSDFYIPSTPESRKHIIYSPVLFNSSPSIQVANSIQTRYGLSAYKYIEYAFGKDPHNCLIQLFLMMFKKVVNNEGRILIVSPTIDSTIYVYNTLKRAYPDLDVAVLNSKVPEEERKEIAKSARCISTTIKSSGAGTDILGLRFLFCMEPHMSKMMTTQLAGRLREYSPDLYTYMFDFFDMGFLPLRNSYKNHDEVMNKIAYATHPFNFV